MTPWEKMFREETGMASAGVSIWAFLIFGGVASLIVFFFLDTYSPMHAVWKGLVSIGAGIAIGYFAARFYWARLLSQAAVLILILVRIIMAMAS